ncbi:hypothetical protein AB0I02_46380 [Streptomyces phaeochromogenes]
MGRRAEQAAVQLLVTTALFVTKILNTFAQSGAWIATAECLPL